MPVVSITRLRLRSGWLLPSFMWHAIRSQRQLQRSPGYAGGGTANEAGLVFWTVTVWSDMTAMKAFRNAGAHMSAMRRLIDICNEASYGHWEQAGTDVPGLDEVHCQMRAIGKPSKVRKPTAFHEGGGTATDRVPGRLRAIAPAP